jgi:uncharacterized protein (DUF1697 family)
MLGLQMAVIVSLLRSVNVGGNHKIKMHALRALYQTLKLRDAQTCVQSGNVVFRTEEPDLVLLAARIERAIERNFGFHAAVMVRNTSQLRDVVRRNPFSSRRGIDPAKLVVIFLAADPGREIRETLGRMKINPEELSIEGRELYIYFPNGMGRSKLPALIDKTLSKSGTARNWNTVTKLLEVAESLEATP